MPIRRLTFALFLAVILSGFLSLLPGGTVVSADQQKVVACSPDSMPLNPPPCGQATARCGDGSWSCAKTAASACTDRDGIACVICPGPLCGTSGGGQQGAKSKKLDKNQTQESKNLVKLLDGVAGGQPAPADFPVKVNHDFLKAQDSKEFVPFTVSIDPATLPATAVAMYVRLVARGGEQKKGRPEYPFEDVHFVDLTTPAPGQPFRFSRAFAVPGGDYDLYLALQEWIPNPPKDKRDTPRKTTVYKEAITVPNLWTTDLATSTIMLAEKVEPLTAPLTEEQQAENPYTLGMTKITPALVTSFTKKQDLSIIFLVYNAVSDQASKKPDVTVEYNFHQKADGAEKFFNKTNPQNFNPSTLPPQFDAALGHQLVAGQTIPLGSFPEGDYRLEIKVTDKLGTKTVTQNVNFTVTAS